MWGKGGWWSEVPVIIPRLARHQEDYVSQIPSFELIRSIQEKLWRVSNPRFWHGLN